MYICIFVTRAYHNDNRSCHTKILYDDVDQCNLAIERMIGGGVMIGRQYSSWGKLPR